DYSLRARPPPRPPPLPYPTLFRSEPRLAAPALAEDAPRAEARAAGDDVADGPRAEDDGGPEDRRQHAVLPLLEPGPRAQPHEDEDRKSTRLNSSHLVISYAVFCLK